MNGQERLEAVHKKQPHDRAPLTTLVDDITRLGMTDELRKMTPIEFYKYLNYDIYQFGNYGLTKDDAVKYPYKRVRSDVVENWAETGGGYAEHTMENSYGRLRGVTYRSHPVKYPVENMEDLRVLKKIWEGTEYVEDTEGCRESYDHMEALLSGYGIYVPIVAPSALQTLLEEDIGTENFYYLYQDYPDEVSELIELMHDRRCQEYRLIAKHMPYDSCITVENTSTTYISPAIYRKISQRHMKDFVEIMHGAGKMGILHMCGLVNDLLYDFIPTGLDGIHALTEPPVGNTNIGKALDILGEDLIIITGLDSTKIICHNYNPDNFINHMDVFVSERLKKANVIFGFPADGLTTPFDRFQTAGEWFAKNGYPKGT